MIDISKAKIAFKKFLDKYEDKSDLSFQLKVVHTYHVAENSKYIAEKLNLRREPLYKFIQKFLPEWVTSRKS